MFRGVVLCQSKVRGRSCQRAALVPGHGVRSGGGPRRSLQTSSPSSVEWCSVRRRSEEVLANELPLFRDEVVGQGKDRGCPCQRSPLVLWRGSRSGEGSRRTMPTSCPCSVACCSVRGRLKKVLANELLLFRCVLLGQGKVREGSCQRAAHNLGRGARSEKGPRS